MAFSNQDGVNKMLPPCARPRIYAIIIRLGATLGQKARADLKFEGWAWLGDQKLSASGRNKANKAVPNHAQNLAPAVLRNPWPS
jgi:hypothetical protein